MRKDKSNIVIGKLRDKQEFMDAVRLFKTAYEETVKELEVRSAKEIAYFLLDEVKSEGTDFFVAIDKAKDNTIAGFVMGIVQESAIMMPYYFCPMVFVTPEYRFTKAGYLLLNALTTASEKRNLTLVADCVVGKDNKLPPLARRFASEKKPISMRFYRKVNKHGV